MGLADIDNDGDLDLLTAASGFLFLNSGDGTFVDASSQSGISGVSTTASFGDYDGDGFMDVLFGTGRKTIGLYRNTGNNNHWLKVELSGVASNRSGIGARLIATSGDLRQIREILGGLGYDQDEPMAHFGLGSHTQVDRLEIRWPSGQVDVLTDIPADQTIRVIEGGDEFHQIEPTRWVSISDAMLVDANMNFELTVRPVLFEKDATITRITADLRPFGGPETVPLEKMDDRTYRLEGISLFIEGTSGFRPLAVAIEQNTSLGPYWTHLSRPIAVFPNEDLRILAEGLAAGWQVEGVTGVEAMDLDQGETVFEGATSGAFQVKPEKRTKPWEVEFRTDAVVDTLGYTTLRIAFHPGDAQVGAFKVLSLTVNSQFVDLVRGTIEGVQVDLERREWQLVEIPLTDLALERPIESIRLSGNLEGIFCLDDIRLVAVPPPPSITAVLEDHQSTRPQSFTLSQNYPNPFNSSTAIRFALPEAQEVELSIYNLAGQQVTRLVDGMREAGTYTVRWDGRDSAGRELASGVYLYRLEAGGGQAETQKLLLLR